MRLLVTVAVLALGSTGCSSDPDRVRVVIQQGDLRVEVAAELADDPHERVRGLRGREQLAADEGMAFLFDDLAAREFTMEGVLIPLDLLVVRRGRLVEIIEMGICRGDPVNCLYRTLPADAAVEVPGGTASRTGLQAGALVHIPVPG